MIYSPLVFVVVIRVCPVATLVIEIVAAGITAPEVSVTVPDIFAELSCARAWMQQMVPISGTRNALRLTGCRPEMERGISPPFGALQT
jgi:hypothetical protein